MSAGSVDSQLQDSAFVAFALTMYVVSTTCLASNPVIVSSKSDGQFGLERLVAGGFSSGVTPVFMSATVIGSGLRAASPLFFSRLVSGSLPVGEFALPSTGQPSKLPVTTVDVCATVVVPAT